VTVKKFTANAAKKCIVAEYVVGGGGAKKEEAPKGPAKDTLKKKAAAPAPAAAKVATPSAYDNVPGVKQQMVRDLLAALKAEGVSLEGKEEKIAAKFTDIVEVPLVAMKNTAYTSGLSCLSSYLQHARLRARARAHAMHARKYTHVHTYKNTHMHTFSHASARHLLDLLGVIKISTGVLRAPILFPSSIFFFEKSMARQTTW